MKYVMGFYWQQKERDIQGQEQAACSSASPKEGSLGNRNSLVLVQYSWKGIPLCFACLGGGRGAERAGAYLTGRMLQWQRNLPWRKMACQPERWLARLEKELLSLMDEIFSELSGSGVNGNWDGNIDAAGFLGVGEHVLLFSRGLVEIHLLNMGFGRGHAHKITPDCGKGHPEIPGHLEGIPHRVKQETDEEMQDQGKLYLQRGMLEHNAGLLLATESFGRAAAGENGSGCLSVGEVWTQEQAKRRLEELGSCVAAMGETDMGAVLLYLRPGKGTFAEPEGREKERVCKRETKRRTLRRGLAGAGSSCIHAQARPRDTWSGAYQKEDRAFLERRGYRVCRFLGQGAFSRVYLARRRGDGEDVACKVSSRKELVEREGRLLQRLEHPLFVAYKECWQEGDRSCLAMEYVPGSSLDVLLGRQGRLAAKRAAQVALELAEGLRYLHTMKDAVLFRDIKPANIMIRQDGKVKLLDLGCACLLETGDAARAGTPGFGAPEQFEMAGSVSPASDVYGVGQVLWAMLGVSGGRQDGFRADRQQDGMPHDRDRQKLPGRIWRLGKRSRYKRPVIGNRARETYIWRGILKKYRQERRCRARLWKVAVVCTRRQPGRRFPDMQSLVKALGVCQSGGGLGKKAGSGNREFHKIISSRKSVVCEKNIWKSTCKNY